MVTMNALLHAVIKTAENWGNTNKGGCETYRVCSFTRLVTFSQYAFCIKVLISTFNSGSFVLISAPSSLLDFFNSKNL